MKLFSILLALSTMALSAVSSASELKTDGKSVLTYVRNEMFLWTEIDGSLSNLWTNDERGRTVIRVTRKIDNTSVEKEFAVRPGYHGVDAILSSDAIFLHTPEGREDLSIVRIGRNKLDQATETNPTELKEVARKMIGDANCARATFTQYSSRKMGPARTWDGKISVPVEIQCSNNGGIYQYYNGILVLNSELRVEIDLSRFLKGSPFASAGNDPLLFLSNTGDQYLSWAYNKEKQIFAIEIENLVTAKKTKIEIDNELLQPIWGYECTFQIKAFENSTHWFVWYCGQLASVNKETKEVRVSKRGSGSGEAFPFISKSGQVVIFQNSSEAKSTFVQLFHKNGEAIAVNKLPGLMVIDGCIGCMKTELVAPVFLENQMVVITTSRQWVKGDVFVRSVSLTDLNELQALQLAEGTDRRVGEERVSLTRFDSTNTPRIIASYGRTFETEPKAEVKTQVLDENLAVVQNLPRVLKPILQTDSSLFTDDCWVKVGAGQGCNLIKSYDILYYSWK